MVGFPASSARRKFYNKTARAASFSYVTSLYRMDRGVPNGYSQADEIVVDYSRKNNRSSSFERITSSDPHGMSGCGIWRMHSTDKPVKDWKPGDMKLVGVTHTFCSKLEVIRGTRVEVFLDMIKQRLR
jgi:hypothetical protein